MPHGLHDGVDHKLRKPLLCPYVKKEWVKTLYEAVNLRYLSTQVFQEMVWSQPTRNQNWSKESARHRF